MFLKFFIVTPVRNGEKYIRETMLSVIKQTGSFDIHYHIQDGLSSDTTMKVVEEISNAIDRQLLIPGCKSFQMTFNSEPDSGMYDALKKGFTRGKGDILAYINADDIYRDNAFELVNRIFREHKIDWLKGKSDVIDEKSQLLEPGAHRVYDRNWIRKGIYGINMPFIQQDSVFWSHNLWSKSGGFNPELKLAGDYDLWTKFAAHSALVSMNQTVSAFRKTPGQLSENLQSYFTEVKTLGLEGLSFKERSWLNFYKLVRKIWSEKAAADLFEKAFRDFEARFISDSSSMMTDTKHPL